MGSQLSAAFMDENELICIRIFIKIIICGFSGRCQNDGTVAISENSFSTVEKIIFWFDLKAVKSIGLNMIGLSYFRPYRVLIFNVLNLGRSLLVITIGRHPVKSNGAKQLLVV